MSSHREAPEISKDPVADSTDIYAFVSPDKPGTVTLIANYIPLEAPAGGPNFYEFGDDVLYEIHIDNNGDGQADISYQFRFSTTVRNPETFLYNTGPIQSLDSPNWNRRQSYDVTMVSGFSGRPIGTGRTFLRGPRGTGFLWVRPEALAYLEPHVTEIAAATWDGKRSFTWHEGAQRFETWEVSYASVLGLSTAVQQALDLGMDEIGRRALALGACLRDLLDAVPGITTYDLGRQRCAIVTCKVGNMATADVAAALAGHGINVSITDPVQTQFDTEIRDVHPLVRLSPHYYNTEAETDRAVEVLAELAAAR